MQHKRGNRIVFYLNDEEAARLEQAVADSDLPRADYLREVLDGVFTGALASTRWQHRRITGRHKRKSTDLSN